MFGIFEQHRRIVGVARLDAEAVAALVELFLVASADGVHLGIRVALIDRDELGAEAEADDGDTDLLVAAHDVLHSVSAHPSAGALRHEVGRAVSAVRLEVQKQPDITDQHDHRQNRDVSKRALLGVLIGGRDQRGLLLKRRVARVGRGLGGEVRPLRRVHRRRFAEETLPRLHHALGHDRIRGPQMRGHRAVLHRANRGVPERADGDHADAGDRVEHERAPRGYCSLTTPSIVGQKNVLPNP